MKLEAAKKKYHGDWIAFKFSSPKKEDGDVLFHAKKRQTLHKKLMAVNRSVWDGAYITYAGPLVPKGVAIILRLGS